MLSGLDERILDNAGTRLGTHATCAGFRRGIFMPGALAFQGVHGNGSLQLT